MTRQQLEKMLPARPKCVWDMFWDEMLREQIVSMIYPGYLPPKEYKIIDKTECNCNGHKFYSTLKIKDANGWFFVETLEASQKKTGEFDTFGSDQSAPRFTSTPRKFSLSVVSDNIRLSEIELSDAMIGQFLVSIDISEQTKNNYHQGLMKLKDFSTIRPDWYTPQGLISYKKYLSDRLDSNSVNTHLTAMRKMFKYLHDHGVIPFNPASEVNNYKQKESRREGFSKGNIQLLLQTIKNTDNRPEIITRDYTMVRSIAKTGLREISIENAMFKDLGLKENYKILWVLLKGRQNKDKYNVLTDGLYEDIMSCKFYNNQEYIFVGHGNKNRNMKLCRRHIRKIITDYMVEAGIKTPNNCVHAIRNFYIQEALKNDAKLEQVQLSVGHADPKTTMQYEKDKNRLLNPAEGFITGI